MIFLVLLLSNTGRLRYLLHDSWGTSGRYYALGLCLVEARAPRKQVSVWADDDENTLGKPL